jgi:hypothetical protein
MNSKIFVPCVSFLMKYFFDIEREITQQCLNTIQLKLFDLKEIAIHYTQILAMHR